ncbi:tetratricopeptide repeat protein [Wohlfahrtiimonas larvae]|uniref:Tetratricopeptide repeat protein n=1 Tax=Wohlfahrtiimonas larvae TaxID=1157986 RepID=A0ABP9MJ00_9GAMM|nr:tetratricopeptide repeat protein [Wohlfahrtiimonas larvae]
MPYFLSILITLICIIHIMKTGQERYWVLIVIIAPMLGPIAYFIVVTLPSLMDSRRGHQINKNIKGLVNPNADIKAAENEVRTAPTFMNQKYLADAYFAAQRYQDALTVYQKIQVGLYANDPELLLQIAKCHFFLNQPQITIQTLDTLRAKNPDYDSSEGHLFYAKALAAQGNTQRALEEFDALVVYYRGYEAKVSYIEALIQLNEIDKARELALLLSAEIDSIPKHVKDLNSDCLKRLKKILNHHHW